MRHFGFCLGIVLAFQAVSSVSRGDELNELMEYLPDDANALIVVRVKDILESPRAMQEDWAKTQQQQFLAGAEVIPPWTELLVRASHLHAGDTGGGWSVALLAASKEINIQDVAAHEHATVQTIRGEPVVRSPRDSFFVQFGPKLLGVMSPAFRQDVARWIQRGRDSSRSGLMSQYLTQTAAGSDAQVLLCFDLEEMFDPQVLRDRIAASPEVRGQSEAVDALARLFAGLRGIRGEIIVADTTRLTVAIDFQDEPGRVGQFVKPLIIEALGDAGAAIDDLSDASDRVEGNSVILSGPLTDTGLRRIMSMVVSPHPHHQPAQAAVATSDAPPAAPETPEPTADRLNADASLQYWNSVNQIINDLERANRRAKDYQRTATWHDNFAEKIDDLPVSGVDPALQEFGADVSSKLRALAVSLRGVPIQVNTLQKSVTYNAHFDPGWAAMNIWGGVGAKPSSYNVTSNLQEVREKQAAAVAAGAEKRVRIWSMIREERAKTLRAMRQKYGDTFK
ncbi:hypothetical protein Mal4_32620 [Maioricimonas rarisocia]|uniref:Uncharacterized protein n=1 Tax=Maioricimonas rarisocia TaxID=2528026 RepID=A0A517Z8W5_9PLAN|nr:hypothetical protein [Maioricimonas rarisocia]QDU38930.1 hypothetical protein Mal4_32620 [Maioricimonas rarisocia]